MNQQFHYDTISEAINKLRRQGFILDFDVVGTHFVIKDQHFGPDDIEIVDLYRYEGNSDPADEATVFALIAPGDLKGILVTGYGPNANDSLEEMIKLLHFKYKM